MPSSPIYVDTCNADRTIDVGQAPTFVHCDDDSVCEHGRTPEAPQAPDARTRVVALLGENRNAWMHPYAYVSTLLARAVVDGKVTPAALDAFPRYVPGADDPARPGQHLPGAHVPDTLEVSAAALAPVIGYDDPEDTESLLIAVDWLRDLTRGIDLDVWTSVAFEAHDLHTVGLDVDTANAVLTSLDVVGAARITLDADEHFHAAVDANGHGYRTMPALVDPDCHDCSFDVVESALRTAVAQRVTDAAALDSLAVIFRTADAGETDGVNGADLVDAVEAALRSTGRL